MEGLADVDIARLTGADGRDSLDLADGPGEHLEAGQQQVDPESPILAEAHLPLQHAEPVPRVQRPRELQAAQHAEDVLLGVRRDLLPGRQGVETVPLSRRLQQLVSLLFHDRHRS